MSNPKNVLAEIVKRREKTLVADLQVARVPEKLNKSTRSLFSALSKPQFSFILECKKASPSKGLIRDDFNIEDIVNIYAAHADAISVLTEPEYFQGDFSYLKQVSEQCELPVLCKDFVLSPEHIRLARFYGADAVLLMLSVLDDRQYKVCADVAQSLDMDILTEVHNQAELERAINLKARIIGINNRDLKTLKTSFKPTKLLSSQMPKEIIVITESGINHHADVIGLANFADACLVGSSLMSQSDLSEAVTSLIYGDIKICGTTNQKGADILNESPCSLVGQVFVPISKRAIEPDSTPLKSSKPKVGIFEFAYHSIDQIIDIAKQHQLSVIQLHGDEGNDVIDLIKQHLPKVKVIKTLHIAEHTSVEDINKMMEACNADEYLLDTALPMDRQQARGGTGKNFDWSLLDQLNLDKVRVAGGINSDNIQSLKACGVTKVDLASGSELSPGVKSREKLHKLFANSKVLSKR